MLVEATLANGRRLRAALVEFGFGAVAPDPSELARTGPGWLLGRVPKRIDILTEIDGVDFRREWARRVHAVEAIAHNRGVSISPRIQPIS